MARGIKTGGRKKGTPNAINADIKKAIDSAVDHVALAKNLARIALKGESEQAQVAATREIWDRRFGKAAQPIGGSDDLPAIKQALTVAFAAGDKTA